MDHPLPWLKYVDAGDLDDDRVDFDGLNVESPTGEHLGDVEGFIVDAGNNRPYYVVVDAGGWFKSKEYLLPIGQARLDADREVLVTDLTRERIDNFPGFDKGEFDRLDADGIRRFNDTTSQAIVSGRTYSQTEHFSTAWARPEFGYPDWWQANPIVPVGISGTTYTAGTAMDTPSVADLTRPVDRSHEVRAAAADAVIARDEARRDRTTERTVAGVARPRQIDPSPHYDGRAQPGDVLGLETGGESTHIGDTADDENARRRDAEQDATKRDE